MVGTAKTTVDAIHTISNNFITPEMFMTDGGSHFNNTTVCKFCQTNRCKHHVTPAYSPWVNGLVEGANKILLHVLQWLCAPEIGEQDKTADQERLLRSWPDHLDSAVNALNHQILLVLKFRPKELLLEITINTPSTGPDTTETEPTYAEVAIHMAYVAQQHLDGYKVIVKHAITRKNAFNKHMLKGPGEVTFSKGQLVQVYCSDLDYMFKTERKLLPKWSQLYRIKDQIQNAYTLEQLDRTPVEGEFSTRRLHVFTPQLGSKLEEQQQQWEN